jgi:hypothetical protein
MTEARRLVEHPDAGTAGIWPRAAALLARQALEQAMGDLWAGRPEADGLSDGTMRSQLLCLTAYVDGDVATRAAYRFREQLERDTSQSAWSPLETERILLAAARVGQHVFAQQVLANCGSRCVFCGMQPAAFGAKRMLLAGHIKPWKDSTSTERLDTRNGLAACPAHDVAFDTGLLAVNGGLRIHVARSLSDATVADPLARQYYGRPPVFCCRVLAGQRSRAGYRCVPRQGQSKPVHRLRAVRRIARHLTTPSAKLAGGQGSTPGPETSAVLRMAVPLSTRPAARPAEGARMSCWPIRLYVFGSSTS